MTSELRKQQYTVTLFDRNHLAHVIYSSFANVQFFALFCFEFEGNFQVQAPGGLYLGLYLEGRFIGGFLVLRLWGLICMYLDGLIHGGAYFGNFTVAQVLSPKFVTMCSK